METTFIQLTEDEETLVEVDFAYYPEESRVYYYADMGGYDGCNSYTTIYSVRLNDVCIYNVMSEEAITNLEERLTQKLETI